MDVQPWNRMYHMLEIKLFPMAVGEGLDTTSLILYNPWIRRIRLHEFVQPSHQAGNDQIPL